MNKKYPLKNFALFAALVLVFAFASCKKDNTSNNNTQNTTNTTATPVKLGLYELDSGEYRELDVAISQIGTQSVDDGLVFDTGSGGMVFDANGTIPAADYNSSGFIFPAGQDSLVVNGITITDQTSTLTYGADSATTTTVYGNLAYAQVVIGDQGSKVTIKRMPFCLYYKAMDAGGNTLGAHEFDTFGVNEEYITFSGGGFITSPFNYYTPGTGLDKGFKMATLGTSNFSYQGTYVPNVVTIGLTQADLTSSGFVMNPVHYYSGDGYVPIFPVNVVYNGTNLSTYALFDSGTSGYSYLEDQTATSNISTLPTGSTVSITTTAGFTYSYTVASDEYLTYIENPGPTEGSFSIISIDYFLNNEYLLDFSTHELGLKNN